jgi:hypothetical protein
MDGCSRRAKRAEDLAFTQAWHTVAFDKMKHGDFKGWLNRYLDPPAKAQTPDQMLAAMMAFQARGANMSIKKVH